MDSSFNNSNDIRRYLRDEMEAEESSKFEKELQQSEDLRFEVLLARQRRAAIREKVRSADKTVETTTSKPSAGSQNRAYLIIGLVVLVGTLLIVFRVQISNIFWPKEEEIPQPTGNGIANTQPINTHALPNKLGSGDSTTLKVESDAITVQVRPKRIPAKKPIAKRDHPELLISSYVPYQTGTLGNSTELSPFIKKAKLAYKDGDSITLNALLKSDSLGNNKALLLRLSAHLAIQQRQYEKAATHLENLRQIPGYKDAETKTLVLCYAALFSKKHQLLQALTEQYPVYKEIYELCLKNK
jgi:hypothetical protein